VARQLFCVTEEPEHDHGSFTSSPVTGERNRWADDGPSGRMMDYMYCVLAVDKNGTFITKVKWTSGGKNRVKLNKNS